MTLSITKTFTMKPSYLLTVALLQLPGGASAQTQTLAGIRVAPPKTAIAAAQPVYRAEGYGRARFGMTVDEVRSTLALDYPQVRAAPQEEIDAFSRSRVLTLQVPDMPPGPQAADISFVFGATSQQLIAVNVIWRVADIASKAQQTQLLLAAAKLAGGFGAYAWPLLDTIYGLVLSPGVSVVFAGHDVYGGGVEVRLEGVAQAMAPAPGTSSIPQAAVAPLPPSPASLRLTLVANSHNPDIFRIPAGSF